MFYYKRIYLLKSIIIKLNWDIILHSVDLPNNILGRIYYKEKLIKINASKADLAFIAICHEIGHLIHYKLLGNLEPKRKTKEFLADFFGWIISLILFSKMSWRIFRMKDKKVTEIRKFTKMEELDKWFDDLIFPGKTKYFIQELEGHAIPGIETSRKICFYTKEHQYFITAIDRTKDDGYLGCQVNCRLSRAGEDWIRGNDLPDGKFNKTTWDRILMSIINYELVKLSKYRKPETGEISHADDTGS